MSAKLVKRQGFGTLPVFLTSLSTILGAVMFLRFGFAVGNLGLLETMMIILLGHTVTIPTAMAIAEISTNQKVLGGGVYYMISRSFGINIGGAIGLALYLSQAISAAFYIIAFAQAFEPVFEYLLSSQLNILITDYRIVSIPSTLLLIALAVYKGASVGMKMLNIVAIILGISLLMFFFGSTDYSENHVFQGLSEKAENGQSFFYLFAICFPAFTGMAAGVGLSGDLKNPGRSIPLGTMLATIAGMIIYALIAYKLYVSASPEDLVNDQLIMQKIAIWGPIIPIGLAAATISSAIGSILVAPRTLQAIALDRILPSIYANHWISKVLAKNNEPLNATLVTSVIIVIFVVIGDIDVVAQIITMFFMVTYGAICSISFLEHFTADPAYRPLFKSRWYLSALGGLTCLYLMFKIDTGFALLSLLIMFGMYTIIDSYSRQKEGLSTIFQGVLFQLSRSFQVFLQTSEKEPEAEHWRPSIVALSSNTFERHAAFNMLRWLSHKYGFGTYIHFINGYLSRETYESSEKDLQRMIKMAEPAKSRVYLDTIVSPSFTGAIAQVIQLPSIVGKDNNMIMFEFSKLAPDNLTSIIDNFKLIKATDFDICILASSTKNFGYKQRIDIWFTERDYTNVNLMILLGFIILGHPEWKNARINLMVRYPEDQMEKQKDKIYNLIRSGRLPISPNNVQLIPQKDSIDGKDLVNKQSRDADLTIIGISSDAVRHKGEEVFTGFDQIGDILFVNTHAEKVIR